jgi:hypothetical protein
VVSCKHRCKIIMPVAQTCTLQTMEQLQNGPTAELRRLHICASPAHKSIHGGMHAMRVAVAAVRNCSHCSMVLQ